MRSYRAWHLSLAAFLVGASPLAAQAQAEPPLRMIFAVWKDTSAAGTTMKHMSKGSYDLVEAYAVLVKDTAGTVDVRQRHNKAGGSATALQASELIDTAIVRLSTPAPSGQVSRLSEEDLKKVRGMFGPRESALILISPKPAISEIERSLGIGALGAPEIVEFDVKK
jgi:hypothetical protein